MTLCAVFAPIPFTDCIKGMFSEAIACCISSAVIEDNIVLAILGPTPETEINNLKTALSVLVIKPKRV